MRSKVKTIMVLGLMAAMLFSGCGETNGVNQDGSKEESAKYTDITKDETATTEDAEITINNVAMTSAVSWDRDDGSVLNLDEKKDNLYFVFIGSVKNLSANPIDFYNNFKAELILDDKYQYPITIDPSDLSSVVPLKTSNFALYSSAPKEVLSSCKSYKLNFGYMKGFESVADVEHCDNQYTYSGSVEEYGSGENIQNFQMFKEYIASACESADILGDKPNLEERTGNVNEVNVSDGNAGGFLTMDDGANFWVHPSIVLNYDVYEIWASQETNGGYGAIRIECNQMTGDEPKNTYYIGAQNLTISSDAGSISTSDTDKSYDYNSLTNHSEVTFSLWANDYSFNQLEEIINGNNVKFTFNIEKSSGSFNEEGPVISADYELDDKDIAAMKFYLSLYKGMPYAKFE